MGTARTLVTNISTGALTLPAPYEVSVAAGRSVVVADPVPLVLSLLGDISGLWRLTADNPADTATVVYGGILVAVLDLPSARVKTLHAAPAQIVAAPGEGNVLVPLSAQVFLAYGGTNPFTAPSDNIIAVRNGASGDDVLFGTTQAFLQGTTSGMMCAMPGNDVIVTKANGDDEALYVWNNNAAEIAGNAAGDNRLRVVLRYSINSAPVLW